MNYSIGDTVVVRDGMQEYYSYELVAGMGQDYPSAFQPFYSPQEMLEMGVFEGKYCNDCREELPSSWFVKQNCQTIQTLRSTILVLKADRH